jgi:hypothetical protein
MILTFLPAFCVTWLLLSDHPLANIHAITTPASKKPSQDPNYPPVTLNPSFLFAVLKDSCLPVLHSLPPIYSWAHSNPASVLTTQLLSPENLVCGF